MWEVRWPRVNDSETEQTHAFPPFPTLAFICTWGIPFLSSVEAIEWHLHPTTSHWSVLTVAVALGLALALALALAFGIGIDTGSTLALAAALALDAWCDTPVSTWWGLEHWKPGGRVLSSINSDPKRNLDLSHVIGEQVSSPRFVAGARHLKQTRTTCNMDHAVVTGTTRASSLGLTPFRCWNPSTCVCLVPCQCTCCLSKLVVTLTFHQVWIGGVWTRLVGGLITACGLNSTSYVADFFVSL